MNLMLAGDIGGTKTQLGLFSFQDNRPVLLKEGTFVSANYAGLAPLVTEF